MACLYRFWALVRPAFLRHNGGGWRLAQPGDANMSINVSFPKELLLASKEDRALPALF